MATKYWVGTDSGNEGDYSVAANWSPSGVPVASDVVILPAECTQNITAGLDQSSVNIARFLVQEGYTGTIGSASGYLILKSDSIQFAGTGVGYISTGASHSTDIDITKTATATSGAHGLYLIGGSIDDLSIKSGTVGLAVLSNETMGVANDVRLSGGKLTLGSQTYVTNLNINGGITTLDGGVSTMRIYDGQAVMRLGVAAGVYSYGGTTRWGGSANITSIHMLGGNVNATDSGIDRTIGSLYIGPGSFTYDPNVISISTTVSIAPSDANNKQPITLKGSV